MRGLPLALAGSTGGLAGVLVQVLREAASAPFAPPSPSPLDFPVEPLPSADLDCLRLHWPSLCLGLALGLILWPLLDLLYLARLYLLRALQRAGARAPTGGLYRLLHE